MNLSPTVVTTSKILKKPLLGLRRIQMKGREGFGSATRFVVVCGGLEDLVQLTCDETLAILNGQL